MIQKSVFGDITNLGIRIEIDGATKIPNKQNSTFIISLPVRGQLWETYSRRYPCRFRLNPPVRSDVFIQEQRMSPETRLIQTV